MDTAKPTVCIWKGPGLENEAREIWDWMNRKEQAAILWDVPLQARQDRLSRVVKLSAISGVAFDEDSNALLGWVVPTCKGSLTGAIHFATAGQSHWFMPVAREFVQSALQSGFQLLIGLIPVHWRGARRLATGAGLTEIMRLPKACFIAQANRNVDGIFMAGSL